MKKKLITLFLVCTLMLNVVGTAMAAPSIPSTPSGYSYYGYTTSNSQIDKNNRTASLALIATAATAAVGGIFQISASTLFAVGTFEGFAFAIYGTGTNKDKGIVYYANFMFRSKTNNEEWQYITRSYNDSAMSSIIKETSKLVYLYDR